MDARVKPAHDTECGGTRDPHAIPDSLVKQPAFAEGFRLRADALRRTKNPPKLASEGRRVRRASQRSAALFLCGAGYAVVFGKIRIARKKNRGRAGRQGSKGTRGPRRLATSRLVEVLVPRLALWFERSAKRAASPPNPRRPARGVYRFAPQASPGGRFSFASARWGFTATCPPSGTLTGPALF